MKQIVQDLAGGDTVLEEVPAPQCAGDQLLIRTSGSLISAGTERMLIEFGSANLLQKARQQPDKVREVLEKARTDGVMATLKAVQNKLDTPLPLGYCNVGVVHEVGSRVSGFSVGDRVASNGKHAEYVCVPQNLCARIPDVVSDEEAVFTVLGAIALQGIRLLAPTLGEAVVVTGLGLIGLMAVQLLRAHGCRVLGIDYDPAKLELARQFGAETFEMSPVANPVAAAQAFSRERGVDAVLITASTKSNEPVHQAATMCRKRGRIVLVGVVGLELSRADFYEKELSFQVSCSYGPGRYDPEYEDKGNDYPVGFVRWTEQRNFEAVLDMMAERRIDVRPLISHRFALEKAPEAYQVLKEKASIGIFLEYAPVKHAISPDRSVRIHKIEELSQQVAPRMAPGLAFIGAGNYASAMLVPAFAATSARLQAVASAGGLSGVHVARKHGIKEASTDSVALLNRTDVDAVVISTRHNSHARWVCDALHAGKHVFVEKPLALTEEDLVAVEAAWSNSQAHEYGPRRLMVGFNRRYAPHVQAMHAARQRRGGPCSLVMTVNAGAIPADHWTQDPEVGGGRLVGEGCHFVDLLRHLAGSSIVSFDVSFMGGSLRRDTWSLQLSFADGSVGIIHYFANGGRAFPKERLELFCDGGILQLDNFMKLRAYNWPGVSNQRLWLQDKGQRNCARAFVEALQSGDDYSLIPMDELLEVARICIQAAQH